MLAEARKRCPKCGVEKPHSEFHKNRTKRDGLHDYCKPCQLASVKAYQNRHGKNILNRAYRYGLTQDDVHALLQVPQCQSCGVPFLASNEQLFDHCHDREHVRGVICVACNTACQGPTEVAIARLHACIDYLKRDLERIGES